MNWFTRFFHEFMNPHCDHCKEDKLISKECKNCDDLRLLLAQEKQEKTRLLEVILQKDNPVIAESQETKPISLPRSTPWRIRQQMLEEDDRVKASIMNRIEKDMKVQTIDELEKELNIPEIDEDPLKAS